LCLATQQYHGLACEAQLLCGLVDVFAFLHTLLQEAHLKEFFEDIKNGKLVLPNFQREFVWDSEKQKKLLSSFICQLPIGSLLILNGRKGDFSCRNLCYTGDPPDLTDECNYLLDGQQRLSSLSGFFSNLFGSIQDYENKHDNLYAALRNRWYIRLEPKEKEIDIFGWNSLKFTESNIFNYEPNDLVDFIGANKVYKNKKDQWWHPAFLPKDESGNPFSAAKRKEKIADEAARNGILPLWEFYEDPERGIHEVVLRKMGERRRHVIEATITDGQESYYNVLGHLDPDVEEKVSNNEDIEEIWMELRTNWKKEIITCIKNSFSLQEIPTISLPVDEVGRAVATFSAVNEGGTRLDPYDLIVARAAKSRQEKSLTTRIVELLKTDVGGLNAVFSRNVGSLPEGWSCESFGALAENVPTTAFKDIFLNALSIYNHCWLKQKSPKVEHIKIKGILDLDHNEINDNVEPCTLAIKRSLSFLCFRCGMRTVSDLNYKLMILPIIYCLFDENVFNDATKLDRIEYWFWLSLFSGRYREYQNEVCVEDVDRLKLFVSGGGPGFVSDEDRLLNYEGYSDSKTLLMEASEGIPGAIANGIMCYILSRQPRDFIINYRINSWEVDRNIERQVDEYVFKTELHDHHIMPLATEQRLYDSTSKLRADKENILNSPINRTYILSKTNNSLGPKTITEYLPKIQEAASFLHCIPAEDFSVRKEGEADKDYYKRFLSARFVKLKATIKEELENLKT